MSGIGIVRKLVAALIRMDSIHTKMMKKTNFGASFFDAGTIQEMNEAPIEARKAIKDAEEWIGGKE